MPCNGHRFRPSTTSSPTAALSPCGALALAEETRRDGLTVAIAVAVPAAAKAPPALPGVSGGASTFAQAIKKVRRYTPRTRNPVAAPRTTAFPLRATTCRRHDEARRCIDYIRSNRHRMRYPAFRAMGLCVGSGVLEAGCKNVVGPLQAPRHALVRARLRRHGRLALGRPQRPSRRLLDPAQGTRCGLVNEFVIPLCGPRTRVSEYPCAQGHLDMAWGQRTIPSRAPSDNGYPLPGISRG